jgi:hypothetical protein
MIEVVETEEEEEEEYTYNIILRHIRKPLLPWKNNKCYLF